MELSKKPKSNKISTGLLLQNKIFILVVSLLIAITIIDISIVRIYDLVSKQFIPISDKKIFFSLISLSFLSLLFILLEIVKPQTSKIDSKLNINLIYRIAKLVQYVLGCIVLYVVIQINLFSYYSSFALLLAILVSYLSCIGILGILLLKLVRWIYFRKHTFFLFLFVCALSGLLSNSLIAIVDASLRLDLRPEEIRPILGGSIDVGKGKFDSLDTAYHYSYIFSFFAAWLSAILLLSYYAKSIGKFKYWLISCSPALFFLGQFAPFILSASVFGLDLDPFLLMKVNTIIATLSKPIGGLMLSLVFWSMAKLTEQFNPGLSRHLWIAGCGLLLLFMANQVILMTLAPFPPFGLSTSTVFGFASYLVLIGIYSSAASVAQNVVLRDRIRKLASSKLLDSFANAELEAQLEKEIVRIVEKDSDFKNDKIISSPSDQEIKHYIQEVLRELRK